MIIGCCKNIHEILNTLKINRFYHKYLTKFIEDNTVDTSHFIKHGINPIVRKTNIETKLVENSTGLNSTRIKQYLFKHNLVVNECAVCKMPPVWNGKPLTLQLDHINGNHYDNRVENLRLICPNCHSQTETYTGRNLKKHEEKCCQDCKKPVKKDSTTERCAECIAKRSR